MFVVYFIVVVYCVMMYSYFAVFVANRGLLEDGIYLPLIFRVQQ